jgi:RNA polymerase-binding protein DksA
MTRFDPLRKQLVEQRERLLQMNRAVSRDLRAPRNPDSGERATETENDPVLEELDDVSRAQLGQIEGALRRLEAETYGLCEACGVEIDPRRLEALPATPHCTACAARS